VKDENLEAAENEYIERGPRTGEGKMADDEFRALIKSIVQESEDYIDSDLLDDRVTATNYFHGRPLGNEKDGRSKVIITEVRDKVLGVVPDLMALFFGPQKAVEFIPTSAAKADAADTASEFISKVVFEIDNPGFMLTHAVLLDGLVRRLGAFKWWWEDSELTKAFSQSGLTPDEIILIASEDGVEISDVTQADGGLFDIEYTRKEDGRVRIMAVPPEELIFLRATRDPHSALFFGHRMEKTRGELIALGVSEKLIEKHGGSDPDLDEDEMATARNITEGTNDGDSAQMDKANEKILYVEGFARIDYDGDGVAELRKVCTIGPGYFPVENKPTNEVPISVWSPIPEPHTIVGQSYADLTVDLQRIKSAVTRGILDSLSTAIFPRTWFKEQDANVSDVMATEIGAPIRTRTGQGAVGIFQHAFVGKEAFPLLTYFDDVSEKRTGHSNGAMGLDADALQSTTKSAADAAVTGSKSQTELVARIFAENALKPMFRGVYRLLRSHQSKARTVKLREQWVDVDPRAWDADLDVQVNVALGSTSREMKLNVLAGVKQTMEQMLQLLGPGNPLFGLGNYRYVVARILELSGFPDTAKFYNPLPLDWQPPPPPPDAQKPDPQMALVQVEAQKAQMQAQAKQMELQLKAQEQQAAQQQEAQSAHQKMALEREKMMLEMELQDKKLRAELEIKVAELAMKGDIESAKIAQKNVADILGAQTKLAQSEHAEEKKGEREDKQGEREVASDRSKEEIAALRGALEQMQETMAHLLARSANKPTKVKKAKKPKSSGKKRIKFIADEAGNITGAEVEEQIEQAGEKGIL
jgi:hypothetical protein